MIGWVKPVLGLALAAITASQAFGQGGTRLENKPPFEIVRSIQAIQDQIVRGSAGARPSCRNSSSKFQNACWRWTRTFGGIRETPARR